MWTVIKKQFRKSHNVQLDTEKNLASIPNHPLLPTNDLLANRTWGIIGNDAVNIDVIALKWVDYLTNSTKGRSFKPGKPIVANRTIIAKVFSKL